MSCGSTAGRPVAADPALCAEVGGLLARLHRVGASYRPAAPCLDERRGDMARLLDVRADHIAGLDGMKGAVGIKAGLYAADTDIWREMVACGIKC